MEHKPHAKKKHSEAEAAQAPAPAAAPPPAAEEPLKDQLLRLRADFDNFRKRTQRERGELAQRVVENLMLDLLPIVDHFELGLQTAQAQQADPALLDGFKVVYDQLMAVLKNAGLTPFDSVGQPFDPNRHEAVSQLPSEEHAADLIMAQTRRGYLLGDRLLRAERVVVSSGPAQAEAAAPDAGQEE
ncbi:MAG: nucleotide exchange factor GrpE [Verrucomicrobia bacterium A1]|nr:MAG: nucleotide exchange factor GrpE [Verrucomicrobia bacterium A1]